MSLYPNAFQNWNFDLAKATEVNGKQSTAQTFFPVDIPVNGKRYTAFRPTKKEVEEQAEAAKKIFLEAFSSAYKVYYNEHCKDEQCDDTIEAWLRLAPGLTLERWLINTFDWEYQEFLQGEKIFIFLRDTNRELVAWMTHAPVSENGDLYLSQCSVKKDYQRKGVASSVFSTFLSHPNLKDFFPGAKNVKLIVRKINKAAQSLYQRAGFIKDEEIPPEIYGESYDDRYVGYRRSL